MTIVRASALKSPAKSNLARERAGMTGHFCNEAAGRHALVVVGMHRSGTSAMTRTLSLLGASLPKQLMPPATDNPGGFWESQEVADLNDEILQALDSEWDDVFAFRPRQYLSNFDRFYLGRAGELLNEQFDGSEVIVLKDPRISILSSFWDRALNEAGFSTNYIIMVRNPLEVAESLRIRNGFPREKSLLLWSSYMLAVERDTRHQQRIFVSYDQLISDWRNVRRRIEAKIGFPFPRDTAAAANEIDRHLDRNLRHQAVAAEDLFGRSDIAEEVKTLYGIFSSACDGAEIDEAGLHAVEVELAKMDALLGPLLADYRGRLRSLVNEMETLATQTAEVSASSEALSHQLLNEKERIANIEAERDKAIAEAEASGATYETRLAELTKQIAASEAERDKAIADAEASSAAYEARLAELIKQTSADEAERDRAVAEAQALRASYEARVAELLKQVESAEAGRKSLAAEAETKIQRQRLKMDELLGLKNAELRVVQADADRAKEQARLELDSAKERFVKDLRESERGREKAEAEARANEKKLSLGYQELATLTSLLRDEERRREVAEDEGAWVVAVSEALWREPRWWSLMPRRWRRLRERRRLLEAGLFDADAYLRRNPDVASAGVDPLQHYLNHGLREGRVRTA